MTAETKIVSVVDDLVSHDTAATLVTLIQAADFSRPNNLRAEVALGHVREIGDKLAKALGTERLNRLIDELCL